MSELSLQKDVIDAVLAAGGHAFKASSPFFKGRADLYVKLPGLPSCWLEVKKTARPVRQTWVSLDLTILQRRFLDREDAAGGVAGVVSFLIAPNKLWMRVYHVDEIRAAATTDKGLPTVDVGDHDMVKYRKTEIVQHLTKFLEQRG